MQISGIILLAARPTPAYRRLSPAHLDYLIFGPGPRAAQPVQISGQQHQCTTVVHSEPILTGQGQYAANLH